MPIEGPPSAVMPNDLAAAVDALDDVSRGIAIENWEQIGEEGREKYLQYLDHGTDRGRRERATLAAEQLLTPYDMLWIPGGGGRMVSWQYRVNRERRRP